MDKLEEVKTLIGKLDTRWISSSTSRRTKYLKKHPDVVHGCVEMRNADLQTLALQHTELIHRLSVTVKALEHYANEDLWDYGTENFRDRRVMTGFAGNGYDIATEALAKIRGKKQ